MRAKYINGPLEGGISEENRKVLATLHRDLRGPFGTEDAAAALEIGLDEARRLLPYLASRGWLARIRRGLYTTVPLDASIPSEWREDTWLVAARAFSPCYVAGWSAAGHWGLTEQIFRDVIVVTTRVVRDRRPEIQGTPFRLKVVKEDRLFGTRTVWRTGLPVEVSDPSRTIVDMLDDPTMGGGIRHVAEMLSTYFEGEARDDALLVSHSRRFGNRTVFKRLGYLVETLRVDAPGVVDACLQHLSSGLSDLDPTVPQKGKILRRWNLRVNTRVGPLVEDQ